MNALSRPCGPSGRRVFRRCTEPGSNGVSRCSTRRYRPSSPTPWHGARASWSAMSCRTATCVSCPWSARPEPALWLKRHGKRPGGSLFPLQPVLGWLSGSCRRVCVETWRGRAYRWRRLHLRTATRPFRHLVGRRSVPPRILAIGQQTGRERPRVLNAVVAQGAGGVAHVLSAAGPTIWPAACEELVVTTATDTRRRASRVAPQGPRARCHHTS